MKIVILYCIFFAVACSSPKTKNSKNNSSPEKDSIEMRSVITYDENLKRDFNEYLKSALNGDVSSTFKYTHLSSMDLIRKKYPQYKTMEELINFFTNEFNKAGISEMNKTLKMKFIPGEILDGTVFDKTKIYWLEYLKSGQNETDKVNFQSNVIAISDDNGINWKFIEFDIPNKDKFIELLSSYYPKSMVIKALDKEIPKKKIKMPQNIIPNNEAETNLLKQFNEYYNLIIAKEQDKATEYIYPEVFKYLDVNKETSKELLKNELTAIFDENSLSNSDNGFKSIIITDSFLSKVTYQNNRLYMFHFYLIGNSETDSYSFGGECVAITEDNGLNWKFVANNDEIRSILKRKFPSSKIEELLKYENENFGVKL